ncbi:hypothetical protein QMY38_25040 [Streptomyces sp. KAU_LT]|nr:hypothetical protein [Streptomyces sp. KAU_LT]MDI9834464.1 hypothetical protein [Streptomyces sp. KAU_LT]
MRGGVVLALVRHELRLLGSIGLWVARRRQGVRGGVAYPYAGGQGAMLFGLAFVVVVESVMMSLLLRGHPVVRGVWFAVDVYTLLLVLGMHAASVVRPHVLTPDELLVRRAAHVELRIPVAAVVRVRRELRTTHAGAEGELNLAVGAQTTVTVELAEPVVHAPLLGRRGRDVRVVRVVRFHADDAAGLVADLNGLVGLGGLTPARSAPSPSPGPTA